MKCWYSAFNAQGSRLIIVVVQLGAVKMYVAAVGALRKKERQDETQFTNKIDGFLSFIPCWMLMYCFAGFFFNLTLCMTKLRVLVLWFCYLTDNRSIFIWGFLKNDIFCFVLKLEISYRIIISWRILVSFRGFFLRLYFLCCEILEFL
jgi:hypothetical protein